MTAAEWRELDSVLSKQVKQCWSYPDVDNATTYAPKLMIEFSPDGTLAHAPALLNPGRDPAASAVAAAATKAMAKCRKIAVPARFHAYYDEWKTRVIHFDAL